MSSSRSRTPTRHGAAPRSQMDSRSNVAVAPTLTRQRPLDAVDEGLPIERLGQEAERSRVESTFLGIRVRIGRYEDSGRTIVLPDEAALQLDTVRTRHLNVLHDARRFAPFD